MAYVRQRRKRRDRKVASQNNGTGNPNKNFSKRSHEQGGATSNANGRRNFTDSRRRGKDGRGGEQTRLNVRKSSRLTILCTPERKHTYGNKRARRKDVMETNSFASTLPCKKRKRSGRLSKEEELQPECGKRRGLEGGLQQ